MCDTLDFPKSDQNRTQVMYIFGHISAKQRQLPDQQVDSGPWVVQLCENSDGFNSPSGWHLKPATSGLVWNLIIFKHLFCKIVYFVQ